MVGDDAVDHDHHQEGGDKCKDGVDEAADGDVPKQCLLAQHLRHEPGKSKGLLLAVHFMGALEQQDFAFPDCGKLSLFDQGYRIVGGQGVADDRHGSLHRICACVLENERGAIPGPQDCR